MKRNGVLLVIFSLCICTLIIACVNIYIQSAEGYLLGSKTEVVEVLLQEELGTNRVALFYLDEYGSVSCAILKKHILGYETLRISGKCSISKPGFLCSYYYDGSKQFWIAWGLATNNNVTAVFADGKEMNINQAGAYTYRICWLIGTGNTPEHFVEAE